MGKEGGRRILWELGVGWGGGGVEGGESVKEGHFLHARRESCLCCKSFLKPLNQSPRICKIVFAE